MEPTAGDQEHREGGRPAQAVERVADAQRSQFPGLLEQPLDRSREAQHGDEEEQGPDDATLVLVPPAGEKMSLTASAPPPVSS